VKRCQLAQLAELGLPITPFFERDGGLAFDLVSSFSGQGRVTIGHSNGVVTIDPVETLDDYREALRIRLGVPYRTMLGHFHHEVGHYYQWVLIEQTGWIDECRELFADERASYSDALDRHYREGTPQGWEASWAGATSTRSRSPPRWNARWTSSTASWLMRLGTGPPRPSSPEHQPDQPTRQAPILAPGADGNRRVKARWGLGERYDEDPPSRKGARWCACLRSTTLPMPSERLLTALRPAKQHAPSWHR